MPLWATARLRVGVVPAKRLIISLYSLAPSSWDKTLISAACAMLGATDAALTPLIIAYILFQGQPSWIEVILCDQRQLTICESARDVCVVDAVFAKLFGNIGSCGVSFTA
jgi:hypothetical protein